MITKRTKLMLAAALTVLLWSVTIMPTHATEAGKKADILAPEAVLTTFHKTYPAAIIRDISKETKDNRTYYEIESLDGTVRRDLLYLPDGTLYESEEAIAITDLPTKVTASLKNKYPKGKLQKAERITRGDVIEYEVLMENGEENLEVLLDSNGIIKSQASVSDEDENVENSENDDSDED